MVETEFSVVRFRGDKAKADKVYDGLQPCTSQCICETRRLTGMTSIAVVAEDIAEEIVWAASRPPHVNIVESLILPVNQATATLNYRGPK